MDFTRQQYGAPQWLDQVDDYSFRALVTIIYGESHLNAQQLLAAYDLYGSEWITESMKPGGSFIQTDWLWDRLIERGGYFEVPSDATIDDQIFVIQVGFTALYVNGVMTNDILAAFHSMLDGAILDWKSDVFSGRSTDSLRDYLVSIGAQDWL